MEPNVWLKAAMRRIEGLKNEQEARQCEINSVLEEGQAMGFKKKILKEVLKFRKMGKAEREEHLDSIEACLKVADGEG